MFRPRRAQVRLFFATDIHGSERCFRKWLAAAAAYKADILILGGDVTGKALVPIVEISGGGWVADMLGESVEVGEGELPAFQERVRIAGFYPVVVDERETAELAADPVAVKAVFRREMRRRLEEWVALADERLSDSGIAAFAMLGNDDEPELADVIRSSSRIAYAEDSVCELPEGLVLVSCGYSTPTPWNTPRELPEDELAALLREGLMFVDNPQRTIFNFHCPPKATHLDRAPKLDENLRPRAGVVGLEYENVGSTAVREAIAEFQPLLGLHGHVHESPGAQKLGSTLCINPGSDYNQGILRGAIVSIDREKGVRGWQLCQG